MTNNSDEEEDIDAIDVYNLNIVEIYLNGNIKNKTRKK